MSTLTIQERFSLDATPDEVWSFLIDPSKVVTCLPGAELTGQNDENTFEGAVKVKVGAVTMSYKGTAVFEETDHEKRFVKIVGRGREKSGSGTVSMIMESRRRLESVAELAKTGQEWALKTSGQLETKKDN